VLIGDFKNEHNHRHRHSALGYHTPAEYAAGCRCTYARWLAGLTESRTHQPDFKPVDSLWGLATVIP
jgi:hypothetical protein